jgi:hypothetical protein
VSAGEGAAGRCQTTGTAEDEQRIVILAEQRTARKQAMPPIGNCASCGQHIRLVGDVTTCGTCRAWHRWYRAWRLSSRYLREVTR